MSKPWEIELTKDQSYKFMKVLKGLKKNGSSSICPFDSKLCYRGDPTCANFVRGLKPIYHFQACPCHKFRTSSLIWRIKRLLKYNKIFIRHKHISIL